MPCKTGHRTGSLCSSWLWLFVTISVYVTTQAEQQTGANRATIKAYLAKLVEDGHLVQHVSRSTWYVAAGQ